MTLKKKIHLIYTVLLTVIGLQAIAATVSLCNDNPEKKEVKQESGNDDITLISLYDSIIQDNNSSDDLEVDTVDADDLFGVDTVATDSISELPWPLSMQTRIDSIIDTAAMLRTSQMGLLIYDLEDDSVLYARDEKQVLRPASTMKLLTAITALDKLGESYMFKTKLCYTGKISNDSTRTLHGDIYCIGGMDPKVNKDNLRAFARSIKEAGIDTIRGTLYADKTMKDDDLYGEGWCWDDDNPMLSALVYNRKDNMMTALQTILTDEGIYLEGGTATKACPHNAKELCTQTHTMEEVLLPMLKNSNNMYAESMFYQIGLTQGKPATAKKAKSVIESIMRKMKMHDTIHRLADGSGLSLYNYVSAELEVAFLRYAHENSNIFSMLYPALPIAGIDGTIDTRMKGTPAANNVHAKTGTVSGISSLAGYCTAPNGHLLCFAIINQGVMKNIYAKTLQDKLCAAMCQ